MKYKRLLILVTCLFFVTVLVFTTAMLFSVREISITANCIENSSQQIDVKANEVLKKYEGKNLLFISETEIKNSLNEVSGYAEVVSVKKNYPNKLEVVVKEKKECFAIFYNQKYYVLDSSLTVLNECSENKNNVDLKPNILLDFNLADYDQQTLKVGSCLNVYDLATKNYLTSCADNLFLNRQNVSKVSITVYKDGYNYKTMSLQMREGVVFNILKANIETQAKLNKTYEFYDGLILPQGNKNEGEYFVSILEATGEVVINE